MLLKEDSMGSWLFEDKRQEGRSNSELRLMRAEVDLSSLLPLNSLSLNALNARCYTLSSSSYNRKLTIHDPLDL